MYFYHPLFAFIYVCKSATDNHTLGNRAFFVNSLSSWLRLIRPEPDLNFVVLKNYYSHFLSSPSLRVPNIVLFVKLDLVTLDKAYFTSRI